MARLEPPERLEHNELGPPERRVLALEERAEQAIPSLAVPAGQQEHEPLARGRPGAELSEPLGPFERLEPPLVVAEVPAVEAN